MAAVAVVRIAASSSSSSTTAALSQQQQQQQDSNNNNNNNDNNNNNAVAVVSSNNFGSFPFFIIINATGRANEDRLTFKRPFSTFFDWTRSEKTMVNDTLLLS